MIWELIAENKRKSLFIFIGMGLFMILVGYFIGAAWFGSDGGTLGIAIALVIWMILSLISYFSGDSILILASRAKEVNHDIHPQLFNVVEEMKIAANLPAMPGVYIIDDPSPNAFAAGRSPEKCSIAVTAGLLTRLNRDELQGVIAHEVSHILNRDAMYMTFAGVMLGSIVMLSEVFLRSLWYSGGSSRRYRSSSSKGSGQAQLIIIVVAIILAILAPIMARIFYFALSRRREYLADASGARLTRYPEGLASALAKISRGGPQLASVNKITAPMYIVNPLKARGTEMNLFSTHPPAQERIRILRSMGQGAGYKDYLDAFSKVKGGAASLISAQAFKGDGKISARKPSAEIEKPARGKNQARDLGDLMRAVNKFVFIFCACGLKIKIPPNFPEKTLDCPRCGRQLPLPLAQIKTAGAVLGTTKASAKPLAYRRKGTGWESFNCPSCKTLLQLSPVFAGDSLHCPKCREKITIHS